THPTTDQGSQQIRVSTVVATGKLLIVSQLRLDLVKVLLAHHCWDLRHSSPLLRISAPMSSSLTPNRSQRRVSLMSRGGPSQPNIHRSQVDWIGQDAMNASLIPAQATTGSRHRKRHQVLGHTDETLTILQVRGK